MTFFVFFIMAVPLATHGRAPQTMAFEVSGGEIQITFPAEPMKVSRQELVEWVRTAVRAVSHYYGKFPVPEEHAVDLAVWISSTRTGESLPDAIG